MDVTSLEQKAIEFAKRGDFGDEARQINEELTRLAPDNQGAWTRLARCCIELGQLDAANTALEAVLTLNPQNMIARSLLQEAIRREVRSAGETEPAPKRAWREGSEPSWTTFTHSNRSSSFSSSHSGTSKGFGCSTRKCEESRMRARAPPRRRSGTKPSLL